jgi:glycosyltransferase involved in cell wall biosynthesis
MTHAPLRVAFVSSHSGDGGSERFLEQVLDHLDEDVEPSVVLLQDGPLAARLHRHAPVVVPTGTRVGLLTGAARLRRVLRQGRYDVVHANGVKAALVCVMATTGVRRRLPVIWMKHDHSRDGRLARYVASRAAVVVGVSRSVLATIPERTATRVVHPGVVVPAPPGDARTRLRSALGVAENTPVLLSVGRLDRAKGHGLAINALAGVRRAHPETVLAIVGGPEPTQPGVADELRAAASATGPAGAVQLLGQRDDVLALLAGADVAVVASHPVDRSGMGAEGFGLVAVEAMAVGTPVVAFAAGALPEVLGECGVLVAVGDVDALADAVSAVLSDPARRTELAHCGMQRARRFDPTTAAIALTATYRAVADGRS